MRHEKWLLECEKVAFEKIREEDGLSSDDEEDEEEDEQGKEEKRKQKQQWEEEQRKADKQKRRTMIESSRIGGHFGLYTWETADHFCPCASLSRMFRILCWPGPVVASRRIRSDPSAVAATVIEWEDWTELVIQ